MTSILDTKSPLLWRACLAGEVSVMEKVMDQGVDPRKTDRNGECCLHMCARSGEVDAFERMVHEGLDVNSANHNGQTPLHIAVSKGHTGMVRYIVRNRGNTDLRSKFSGMTALHLSCVDGEEDIVNFLLDNGANCAIQDAIGKYADDYTDDDSILQAFASHFPVCRHGRKVEKGSSRSGKGREEKSLATAAILNEISEPRNDVKRGTREEETREERGDSVGEDEENEPKSRLKRKEKKRSSRREKGNLADKEEKKIYDKMEHYDVDRAKQNWDKAKQGGKKIKVNHSLGFSDEHKERMAKNVFDRLMGGKKK